MRNNSKFIRCVFITLPMLLATPVVMAQAAPQEWRFTVGIGAAYQPKYPGSDSNKAYAVPVVSAGHGRFFIGGVPDTGIPVGAGLFLVQQEKWRVGLGVGRQISKPRKESDSRRLRGLGDVDQTTLGALFASYTDDWYAIRANVVTDLEDNGQGTRASVDVEGRYKVTPNLMLSAGPGATWADSDFTETFFGIDESQSRRSGRKQHSVSSGLYSVNFSVGANYKIDPNWSVRARFNAVSLKGDAEDSPITESKSQNSAVLFTTYSF